MLSAELVVLLLDGGGVVEGELAVLFCHCEIFGMYVEGLDVCFVALMSVGVELLYVSVEVLGVSIGRGHIRRLVSHCARSRASFVFWLAGSVVGRSIAEQKREGFLKVWHMTAVCR